MARAGHETSTRWRLPAPIEAKFSPTAEAAYNALIEKLKRRGVREDEISEIDAILSDIQRLERGEEIDCFVTHGRSTIVTIEPGQRHWATLLFREDATGRRLDVLEFH